MPVVNEALAILTVIALAIIIRGLVSWALERERSATMHFALGVSVLAAALVLRALYWDVLPVMVGPKWEAWGEATGWTKVNAVWHLLVLFASYHLLRAMQLLIPDDERDGWPLWRAPFYPHGHLFERIIKWWWK